MSTSIRSEAKFKQTELFITDFVVRSSGEPCVIYANLSTVLVESCPEKTENSRSELCWVMNEKCLCSMAVSIR